MSSYKFYYINLDKSKVRRDFMENQFKKFNIPLHRMPAIYGKKLPALFLKKAKNSLHRLAHFPYLNDGEIGLTKTYFDLWEIIKNQKEDYAIVLEDDALIDESFINDLPHILKEVSTSDFIDISGRKGYYKLNSKKFTQLFVIPPLQTTAQIIGKKAASDLSKNLNTYYAPIDVLKQDVFKHKTPVYITKKKYVKSNDTALGGTTLQQKGMPKFKKVIREIIRPIWQIIALFTYKTYRFIGNLKHYKKVNN